MNPTPNLQIGVDIMDHEHQLEFKLLDALNILVERKDRSQAVTAAGQLLDYIQTHFLSEELLMRVHAFPQYSVHEFAHSKLISEVSHFSESLKRGELNSETQLKIESLRTALLNHILEMDAGMGRYLLEIETAGKLSDRV